MNKNNFSLFVLLLSVILFQCKEIKHIKVIDVKYYPSHSEFYLSDGRTFIAPKNKNEPYYSNIRQEILKAKSVYFHSGEMYIDGTGEDGEFISKSDISLVVHEKENKNK